MTPLIIATMLICSTHRGGDGEYWSWRLIDGRKCWHKGTRIPKERLTWERPKLAPAEKAAEKIVKREPTIRELLMITGGTMYGDCLNEALDTRDCSKMLR